MLTPPSKIRGNVPIVNLGLTDYQETHKLQLELHSSITLNNSREVIIITEHYPVYTCGRTTKPHDRPLKSPIPMVDVERGGELTYHGPGQIVGYPILNLSKRRLSIPQYLRTLENALAKALLAFDIESHYREEHRAGLWVGHQKIVSIGIAVRRWVTFHGFAINVDCDLEPFKNARPCGLSGNSVTSLKELGYNVPKGHLREAVKQELLRAFF
ncbi:MAG: lipoyl(octanoyl) transferase [Deltaproteobacteria bacterium RIFCSPLOWO2_01_44_7]|nr:MAG: lipoyl(octanoyl) transferase [Deltaproteobacteria bacterium RIFCSPHIGHO2_01_FULL_43_49]OGQ15571.1 MAG: lipoyl(octanoyl) transferase [Deltaproteobacteria bacterium RIFCSPHIGHO2_02_FULL_44_53]OGQ29705.1 MAG: lipoyl(octanoyl) transferase [Deltaproteobacteria bacterium RIFCSPHIGHO2_12_FULL_44_21]OGQ32378.1 MAG: lipoyl(octanoyl) transferase [Deltaproteobacteria bacterium RIFCSPLOWO2_01_FULL_45_74]OGQ41311.1 MAG: lipoyl(octanoyl) transferase [Deltaproteobacteria bacterium RIFCSPLOWO2_01_44_7]